MNNVGDSSSGIPANILQKFAEMQSQVSQCSEEIKKNKEDKKNLENSVDELKKVIDDLVSVKEKSEIKLQDAENKIKKFNDTNSELIKTLFYETQRSQKAQSQIYAAQEITKVSVTSLASAGGVGTVIGGAILTPFCPPLGLMFIAIGGVATATSVPFMALSARSVDLANRVKKRHPELTFKQASMIVDNGYIKLRNEQNQIVKYTKTDKFIVSQ